MKKVPFLRLLTAVGSALSAVALLDLTGVANVLSPGLSNYLLAAGPIALALKELVVGVGDILDDGKANRSFKLPLLLLAFALLATPFLSSCTLDTRTGTATLEADAETVRAINELVRTVRADK
ncbi:hypothetical protein [Haloferula sp. A504]|uniref:hypothetical protein n=1 Tax=Haloferula sp. A504 TaxID=3373601 RepID=UPI0031C9B082|nr:hypothetical protein [Verrucomicrobiaceae bacterium E54]